MSNTTLTNNTITTTTNSMASGAQQALTVHVVPDAAGVASVQVHHYHHFEGPHAARVAARAARVASHQAPSADDSTTTPSGASTESSRPVVAPLLSGSVRLVTDAQSLSVDGSPGCYLGVDSHGALVANASGASPLSIFEVVARGHSADGEQLVSLRSVGAAKCVRITSKGGVDCGGGMGRWTLFAVSPAQSAITLKSVGNTGKANVAGSVDWYLGVRDGKPAGDMAAFSFAVMPVAAASAKPALSKEERMRLKEDRLKAKEERIAAKQAARAKNGGRGRNKAAETLPDGWCLVVKASDKKKAVPKEEPHAPAAPKANAKAAPKAKSGAFPVDCVVTVKPAAFAEAQNRKGTVGWHIGCAPMGYLVADASSGSWGQWRSLPAADGAIVLEALHTPAFHLAIRKDLQLTHRGGKGAWAQFKPVAGPRGSFALKSVGHGDTDVYLAVNGSGVLYAAPTLNKDARFIVAPASE